MVCGQIGSSAKWHAAIGPQYRPPQRTLIIIARPATANPTVIISLGPATLRTFFPKCSTRPSLPLVPKPGKPKAKSPPPEKETPPSLYGSI